METNSANIYSLTNNNFSDRSPQISGQNVVWIGNDGNDEEIFLYDHEKGRVIQLTDNDTYESNPQIDGNNVVWSGDDGNDQEIYLYNGSEIIQLTDNDTYDDNPQISNGNVAWLGYEGEPNYRYYPDNAIYFYDGDNTTRLTEADSVINNLSLEDNKLVWSDYDGKDSEIFFYDGTGITQLTTNSASDSNPQISGNNIVWSSYEDGDSEIFLYDGSEILQLTDNDTYDSNPQISGNNVAWVGSDDSSNNEVYFYDGSETTQPSNDGLSKYNLQISGDNVVWSSYDNNDEEIYLYDGSTIVQLTDDDTYHGSPQIDGSSIVWSGYREGGNSEIYLNYAPNLAPGSIKGYKWHDLNQNGLFDSNELGIPGWTIYLDANENGQLDEGETSTVTDSDGLYTFTDLQFGNYTIAEQLESRWIQTAPVGIEYLWQDSKQPGGVSYNWFDISSIGTEVTLGDDEAVEVALPFDFDFYGVTNNSLTISANGYLTFDGNGTEYYNSGIGQSYSTSNFIAPFWDDLNPGYTGAIYHHYDAEANRFIVQYQDIARYEIEGALTFQTILNADGSIIYQYDNLAAPVNSATVGLENPNGDGGLQIVHNNNNPSSPYLENGLAIAFTPISSSDTANTHQVFLSPGETTADLNFGNKLNALRLETEDYQDYFDTSVGNSGGEYRDDDVDLGLSGDVNGGYTLGWTDPGEWLTYNIDVPEDGTYQVVARIASDNDMDHSFDVSIGDQITTLNFGSTGGWQTWQDIAGSNLELTAGSQELRLDLGSSGFNLNYIDLITPENIRLEAEDYQDRYYPEETFYDTDYDNQGGGYRSRPVDIEPTQDIGGGFNVGWIEAGEWLTYSVEIPYDGDYQIVGRVASEVDTAHSINVSIADQSTTLNFGDTGGWQSWSDTAANDSIYLSTGTYELRLDMGSSYFNLNYIDLINSYNFDGDDLLLVDGSDF